MDHMDDYSDLHLIEEFIDEAFEDDESACDDDASAVAEVSHTPRLSNQPERSETFVSPGGTKYWIPYVSDDVKLSVGDGFPSSEAADIAYRKYADEAGFDVRQSNRKKNNYDIVQTRYLLCSRQGVSEKRTMILWIQMLQNGRCVTLILKELVARHKFEERHNHALYSHAEKRFSRGRRQLQYTDYRNIYNATGASIGGSKAHNIQSALRGGVENVSASIQDYKNASRDMIAFVGNNDAQMLINLMTRRESMRLSKLQSIFCADEISKLNYKEFGDTISFDATYRTNRHAMNFVPFIAIDNHKRSVVVGSTLISSEDGDNFTWVLNTFIKAHWKEPRFVITDQCLGMKEAITTVFSEAKHRLCCWHIMKKTPSKVTISKDAYVAFKKRINKIVWSTHIDATYFEEEWHRILLDFESWISAYYKDDPMSSLMRTTSRSESSHAYFSLHRSRMIWFDSCGPTMALLRNSEINTHVWNLQPEIPYHVAFHLLELSVMLLNYTQEWCFSMFRRKSAKGDVKKYSVSHKKKNLTTKASYEVLHDVKGDRHTCECNMFVHVGLICRHIFKVLMNDGIDKIPEHFICKRWTRALIHVQVQAARARYGEVDMEKESLINVIYADFDLIVSRVRSEMNSLREVSETLATMKVKYGASFFANNPAKDKAEALKECYGMDAPADPEIMHAAGIRNKGCGRGKRLIGALEKAVEKNKRPLRVCRVCNTPVHHDSRNCPQRNTR
ncbi:hypothetical protein OSB04_011058 [Centaurea solstitialis]|uniref:SWIM-type domain-containing protein n=1 Tax=Centaurea solstitialis TaxID=347529 RepID=A0AA38WNR1_9ASTR|nr:hypothetical protein OSB04_011058 [Centaurea solstitialis]